MIGSLDNDRIILSKILPMISGRITHGTLSDSKRVNKSCITSKDGQPSVC